jgi:hypothetical protein
MNVLIQFLAGALTGAVISGAGALLGFLLSLRSRRARTTRYQVKEQSGKVLTTVTVPTAATAQEKRKVVDAALDQLGYGRVPAHPA